MGIDFLKPRLNGTLGYLPNLEPGDIVRLVEVLELVRGSSTVRKLRTGEIRPFEIRLTFKRRIVIGASPERSLVAVRYYDYDRSTHREKLRFRVSIATKSLGKLAEVLRSLVAIYLALINVWRKGEKLPPRWVVTRRVK
jgi:hypothetical protein